MASLARSQPDTLQHAKSRSPTRSSYTFTNQEELQTQAESRAFGLRDRKALRPSLTSDTSRRSDKNSPSRRSSGLQAFAVPPRRVSRRILPSDLSFLSPMVLRNNRPGKTLADSPEDQLASELSNATGETDPHEGLNPSALHEGFEEPDLPPTPTQLGLERPPARPKGLLSSSPTAQSRNWGKRRTTDHLEQSPSKLRSVHYGDGEEDSSDSAINTDQALFSEPVLKKRKLKKELSAELKQIKDDIAELENCSNNLSLYGENTAWDLSRLTSILAEDPSHSYATPGKPRSHDVSMSSLISTLLPFSTTSPRIAPEEPLAVNPFALDALSKTEPFLTIFAPLNLRTHSSTHCGSESRLHLEKHTLELSTQSPFPSNILSLSINYETNPETQSILSVSVSTRTLNADSSVPVYLRQWIGSRLANPLLNLDVSGLCWGINRYWEAVISRAQLWSRLEDQSRGLIVSHRGSTDTAKPGDNQKPNIHTLPVLDLRRILPHLERTTMLFESKSEPPLTVYLSCELILDEWAGEPQLVPGISVSAPSKINGSAGRKIEQDAKRLFHAILNENQSSRIGAAGEVNTDTIVQATESVLTALFGVDARKSVSGGKARR